MNIKDVNEPAIYKLQRILNELTNGSKLAGEYKTHLFSTALGIDQLRSHLVMGMVGYRLESDDERRISLLIDSIQDALKTMPRLKLNKTLKNEKRI